MNDIAARAARANESEVPHLEFLMLEAGKNLDEGNVAAAITNLVRAVIVSNDDSSHLAQFRMAQLARRVIKSGNEL